MNKNTPPHKSSESTQPSLATTASVDIALTPFWLLHAGTAKKLGQHSAGILNYHIVADGNPPAKRVCLEVEFST